MSRYDDMAIEREISFSRRARYALLPRRASMTENAMLPAETSTWPQQFFLLCVIIPVDY